MLNFPIYLDYSATTPCDTRVVEAMLPYFSNAFGNAASHQHAPGWQAREATDYAREQVAALIGAIPEEIIFTSGATEAANLALKGVFESYASKGNHIITCAAEHKAVLDTCRYLEKTGGEVTYLAVNSQGQIDLAQLEAAITPQTILIAIQYANNETGTIMPVKEIGAIARKNSVLFFSDATQAAGKIPVDVNGDSIDLLAFSAHKLYGPKGTGALYVRRRDPRVKLAPQLHGGGHERGLRSGTLNVPGIVGFGKACEIARLEMETEASRLQQLRDKLQEALLEIPESELHGDPAQRLPHVVNIGFNYLAAGSLLTELTKDMAVSAGSACTSGSPEPSYVLKAMGIADSVAHNSIRFSLGRATTEEEIGHAIGQVAGTVHKLRDATPLWEMHHAGIDPYADPGQAVKE